MTDTTKPRLLVTGASGRLGRKVLAILQDRTDVTTLAATRTPENRSDLARTIEVRRADFDQPTTMETAFQNIDRLLLISTNELSTPGRRIRQHQDAIAAAVKAGVPHIIYTSMPDPVGSTAIPFAPDHTATEKALADSGAGYTILRIAWYAENLSDLQMIPTALASGEWPSSAGEGRIAYVPVNDVARAAAAALANAEHGKAIYDITGREAHTAPEIAAMVGEAYSASIAVRRCSDEQLGQRLKADGVAAMAALSLIVTDANTRAGKFNIVSSAIEDLTGRPPASLREHFRSAAKASGWRTP